MQTMHKLIIFVVLASALLFLGCVSPEPEQNNGVSSTPQEGGGQNVLSVGVLSVGVYFKGPVEGAAVSVYSLKADGSQNKLLAGPIKTDEKGGVDFEIPQPTERFLVESVGGAYFDDAGRTISDAYKGESVSLPDDYTMRSFVPAENNVAVVTPFTEMAASLAQRSVRKGVAIEKAARAANTAVSQQYRQENVIRIVPAAAFNPSAVATSVKESREYGLLLAGMVQEARAMNVEPAQLAVALAEDWSDGKLDGAKDGKPINLKTKSGNPIALSASASLAGLQTGIDAFLASPVDATQITQFPILATQVSTDPSFYIDESMLPAWIDGEPGSYTLTVVGGKSPYSWKLKKGSSLPSGFSLSPDGTISGTGNLQGSVGRISPPFIVVASDSSKPAQSREIELRIEIIPGPPQLEVGEVECNVGSECNVQIASKVIGGTPPYHFVAYASESGSPYSPELMLWLDGTIRGTPTNAGDFVIQACVVDLIGWQDCKDVNIHVGEGPTATPTATPRPTATNGGGTSCEPGHHAVYCGGQWRCCLNGWVCLNSGRCGPSGFFD